VSGWKRKKGELFIVRRPEEKKRMTQGVTCPGSGSEQTREEQTEESRLSKRGKSRKFPSDESEKKRSTQRGEKERQLTGRKKKKKNWGTNSTSNSSSR